MSSERDSAIPNTPEARLLRLVGKFVAMVAAGRARWQIANEAFKTLKPRVIIWGIISAMATGISPVCWQS